MSPPAILALESSCDETSAAVVRGTEVLSNIVASQVDLHAKWGGVVPEAAARAHVQSVLPVVQEALATAGIEIEGIGAVAVTNRPGLVGALSVGLSAAKAIAFARRLPLLGIDHLEGHLASVRVVPGVRYPHVALIVSGGHTELVEVRAPGDARLLGQTRDDAAGEAFDKGARVLGLGYPGGRAIQEAAKGGNPKRYPLPRGLKGDTFDFSFSGLKTAVLRLAEQEGASLSVPDAAASLQEAIVSVLAERAVRAAQEAGASALALVGGVAANGPLRERLRQLGERAGLDVWIPPLDLCTDNAAMIGLAAAYRLEAGECDTHDLDALPSSDFLRH